MCFVHMQAVVEFQCLSVHSDSAGMRVCAGARSRGCAPTHLTLHCTAESLTS